MDILSIIKLKNPDEITQKELNRFEELIEEAICSVNKLQRIHRELTGKEYVPPVRLR